MAATAPGEARKWSFAPAISTLHQFFPEGAISELSELVLDITALMELVDVSEKEKHYVK